MVSRGVNLILKSLLTPSRRSQFAAEPVIFLNALPRAHIHSIRRHRRNVFAGRSLHCNWYQLDHVADTLVAGRTVNFEFKVSVNLLLSIAIFCETFFCPNVLPQLNKAKSADIEEMFMQVGVLYCDQSHLGPCH